MSSGGGAGHRPRARRDDDDAQGAGLIACADRWRPQGFLQSGDRGAGGERQPLLPHEPQRQAASRHARAVGRRAAVSILHDWKEVIECGKPQVSNVYRSVRAGDSPTFSISVPVKRGAKTIYALSASIAPQRILDIFQRAKLDPGWVATVTDRDGDRGRPLEGLREARRQTAAEGSLGRQRRACGPVAGDRRRRRAGAARLDLFAAVGLAGVDDRARGDRQPADRAFVGARRHAGGELRAVVGAAGVSVRSQDFRSRARSRRRRARARPRRGRGADRLLDPRGARRRRGAGKSQRNAPADGAVAARERGSAATGARLRRHWHLGLGPERRHAHLGSAHARAVGSRADDPVSFDIFVSALNPLDRESTFAAIERAQDADDARSSTTSSNASTACAMASSAGWRQTGGRISPTASRCA